MNKKILSLTALAILGASSLFSATLSAAQMTADTGMTTFGDVMGPVDPDTGRVYGTYEDEDLNEFFAGEDIADVPYVGELNDRNSRGAGEHIDFCHVSIPLDGVKSCGGTANTTSNYIEGHVKNEDPSGAYARYDIRLVDETTGNQLGSKKITLDEGQSTYVASGNVINRHRIRLGARDLEVQGTKTTIKTYLSFDW